MVRYPRLLCIGGRVCSWIHSRTIRVVIGAAEGLWLETVFNSDLITNSKLVVVIVRNISASQRSQGAACRLLSRP